MTGERRFGGWALRASGCAMAKLVALLAFLVVGPAAAATADDAKALLKRMADHLAAQQTIQLTFDSAIEVVTPELEKIQFTNSGKALLARPDRLYAHRIGGYSDVALYFDGKTVTIYGEGLNAYAQFDGPASVDALIEALRVGHGVALPGADLLLTNSFKVLSADILEAKHIGRGVVGGRLCDHLAFRNFDTDWQLWVENGERPIPCKMVITSKTINGAPQYTLQVTGWKDGVAAGPADFAFTPPPDAQVLGPDQLIEFDELPQGAPSGGDQ